MTEKHEHPYEVTENRTLCIDVDPEGGSGSGSVTYLHPGKKELTIGFFPMDLRVVGENGEAQFAVEITWPAGIKVISVLTGEETVVTTFKGNTATFFWEKGSGSASIAESVFTEESGKRVELFLNEPPSGGETLTVKLAVKFSFATLISAKFCTVYTEGWKEPGESEPPKPKPPSTITAGLPAVGIVRPDPDYLPAAVG